MNRLTTTYNHLRGTYPALVPVGAALVFGVFFSTIQILLPRPDALLSPLQVACFAAGGYLMLRDGMDAAELEARRRGDVIGQAFRGLTLGLYFFCIMTVGLSSESEFWGRVGATGLGSVVFGVAMMVVRRGAGQYPLDALSGEFVTPETPPSIWMQLAVVCVPLLGIALAGHGVVTAGPSAQTVMVLILFAGLLSLHQPKSWRLGPRMLGALLIVVPILI